MKSIAEYEAMSEAEKLAMLKAAIYYDGWRPYCLTCTTMARMRKMPYGFKCGQCGNMIGWDLIRVLESPLNKNQNNG